MIGSSVYLQDRGGYTTFNPRLYLAAGELLRLVEECYAEYLGHRIDELTKTRIQHLLNEKCHSLIVERALVNGEVKVLNPRFRYARQNPPLCILIRCEVNPVGKFILHSGSPPETCITEAEADMWQKKLELGISPLFGGL